MPILSKILGLINGTNTVPEDKTLGVDVSHWQGPIDWHMMRSNGVRWGITKATDIGWDGKGFVDKRAVINHTLMAQEGILTGAYCWLDPRTDPYYQAKFFLDNFYSRYTTDFPPVLDFEDSNVNSWSDMLWRAQTWLAYVEQETDQRPMVYTSPGFMRHFDRRKVGFMSHYPLWVAHYIQRPYPDIPFPWQNWIMWQYSDKGHYPYYIYRDTLPGRGKDWGVTSYGLDMNWFNGTYEDVLEFITTGAIEPDPPEPIEPFSGMCNTHALNIRYSWNMHSRRVGYLVFGDVVQITAEKNGWYKIGENKWVKGTYIKKLPEGSWFKAKCRAYTLRIRNGPGTSNDAYNEYLHSGDVVDVYYVLYNWYKISEDEERWVSGYWMQRLD